MEDYIDVNRKTWDQKVGVHVESEFYNVKGFLSGENSLRKIELPLVQSIAAKDILHSQCHFGLDTLSLARLGLNVTGVDFSDEAIIKAKALAEQTDLPVNFVCDDVMKLIKIPNNAFDLVFTTYGVLGWLHDLKIWAQNMYSKLRSGGTLLLVEFHPYVWSLDDEFKVPHYDYFKSEAIVENVEFTYADVEKAKALNTQTVTWNHSISEVYQALKNAGFQIADFNEYDFSPYPCFPNVMERADQEFVFEHLKSLIPMAYHIQAVKP